jgi:hypothetical protein
MQVELNRGLVALSQRNAEAKHHLLLPFEAQAMWEGNDSGPPNLRVPPPLGLLDFVPQALELNGRRFFPYASVGVDQCREDDISIGSPVSVVMCLPGTLVDQSMPALVCRARDGTLAR